MLAENRQEEIPEIAGDGHIAWADEVAGVERGEAAVQSAAHRQVVADRERDEIRRLWPTVMRRVGGYNLDIFEPRSQRPYTPDGGLNLAHLLVGSEGTLAWTRRLTLKLSPLPGAKA